MKKWKTGYAAVILVVVAVLVAAPSLYSGESSVELGKKLFEDPALGGSSNATSCDSCHPGGKGLQNAGGKKNLGDMINQCIAGPLKGSKLDGESVEMQSLRMYIDSLGK